MANVKISDLNEYVDAQSTDVVPCVDLVNDQTKKIKIESIAKANADGTAASPSVVFASDKDTGIYRPTTNQFGISTGGTSRFVIDSSGNITISGNLSVSGTTTANIALADNSVNGDKLTNDITIANNLTVTNDLTVNGTTTTINSTTLQVDDKNIELGTVATPSDTTADGGGITLKGATDKTLTWIDSTNCWTFNQGLNLTAGTAAAPALIFNGDVNSGFFQPAGDKLAIATGGTSRITIGTTGNVGIGVTGPQEKLHVNGDILIRSDTPNLKLQSPNSSNPYYVAANVTDAVDGGIVIGRGSDLNSGSHLLAIKPSGNVGIGTASPTKLLHLSNSSPTIRLTDTDTNAHFDINANSSIGHVYLEVDAAQSGSHSSLIIKTRGSEKFRIVGTSGNVGIGTTSPQVKLDVSGAGRFSGGADPGTGAAIFTVSSVGNFQSVLAGYKLAFHTGNNNVRTERVRISETGNVGIGTTNPSAKFDIANDTARIQAFRTSASAHTYIVSNSTFFHAGVHTSSNYYSVSKGNNPNDTDLLVVDSNGNIGIGTTNPQQDLHVSGTTSFIRVEGTNNASGSDVAALEIKTNLRRAGGLKGLDESDNELWFIGRHYSGGGNATRLDFDVAGSTAISIPTNGNVGIKQTSPDHLLHIGSATNVLGGTAGDQLDNLTIQSDTANTDYLNFTTNRISTGSSWTTAAQRIQRKVDSTLMGYIQFGNYNSDLITFGNYGNEYVRINGSGNVGIGTIGPDKLLHVQGNNNPQIKVSEANNSTSAGLEIENQGQRNWQIWADRSTDQFRVGNNVRASTNFAITSTGNVGVGTTGPQAKLDVNGTAFIGEGGEDNEILRLNTDRTWSFFQRGSGAQTSLDLASSDNKSFTISSLKTGETSASASVFIGGSDGNVGIGTISPTQKLDVNGTIEANDLTINGSSFRNIPKISKTAAYTLLVSDLGKVVCITTGGVTIPSGVFSSGDAVTIYNASGSNQTITRGSGVTLRIAGTSTSGNKTLAGYGLCTVLCVASNVFVVGGAGLS